MIDPTKLKTPKFSTTDANPNNKFPIDSNVTNTVTKSSIVPNITTENSTYPKCDNSTKNCHPYNASDEIILFISIIFWFIFSLDIC